MISVTITGADNAVDPSALVALSAEFPFVEWGILASRSRLGTPRYPSSEWVTGLLWTCEKTTARLAIHLCGENSAQAMQFGLMIDPRFDRVQINGWKPRTKMPSKIQAPGWGQNDWTRVILQARSLADLEEVVTDAFEFDMSRPADVLFDPSGGRGIATTWPEAYPSTIAGLGIAGGISPMNVLDVLKANERAGLKWIDMESGVRTDDAFDLVKVRSVLEQVASVREAARS